MIRALIGVVVLALLVAGAVLLTRATQLSDRLLSSFLALNPQLPSWMSFEQFLAMLLVACVLGMLLTMAIAAGVVTWMSQRVRLAQRRQSAQETALQRALERLNAQVKQEYERLIGLSTMLTQRLDKRAILQNVLQAASQMTSLPHTDSVIGLWVLEFQSELMQFEMGVRCDERVFTKREFSLNEPPLNKLASTKEVLASEKWQDLFPFVTQEKAPQLAQASAVLIIPLIIERTVLGCLVVFCHPDLLKGYEEQRAFFNAAWGQLTLALAIAIQGELAILDRLTGMVNQAYFFKRLTQELERSTRYQVSVSVLMIDIDNFKAVNDTLGHPQGDAVLKIVSRLIKHEVRAIDLAARYGGEEFIVMLPETGLSEEEGGVSGAALVAERIRKAIETEFHDLQKPLTITVSLGVAVRRYPDDRTIDARELIRRADEQLYKAKTTGKNKYCVYLPESTEPVS